ncbi:MAG: glutamyl-tRNA reductase [Deltaproteobacteria bacterium]|nr:MAG: glutamyl-tRNA reductase [Deltaproteobacteria bacterium]
MKVLLVGLSHRTAPVEVRERFAVEDPGPALTKLARCDELEEAVLISTCNRVEAVVLTRTPEAARLRLRSFFGRDLAPDASDAPDFDRFLYEYTGGMAVHHLFRVASAVDSMVVGEPQILGQVKQAYRLAAEYNAIGPILSRLFSRAFATAKRVRRETGIAERSVSVARVAVDLARQVFERFTDKEALLVGAGEMIELSVEALRRDGLSAVRVANRTVAHAEELARRVGGSAHGLEDLPALMERSDLVLTCIDRLRPILDAPLVAQALHARRGRRMLVIDLGVPRNVAPDVNELADVYLYDVDDLQEAAAANAEERRRETLRAEAIINQEQQRFEGWMSALEAVPTIRHLRARGEAVRARELERGLRRLGLTADQRRGVEVLSRAIVNKLLHAPVTRLRAELEDESGIALLETARVLFALDDASAPGAEIDAEFDPGQNGDASLEATDDSVDDV